MKAKNILSLSSEEAMQFLLQSDQYHTFELPEYFDFTEVFDYIKKKIGNHKYEDCLSNKKPDDLENVNMDILMNKDGHYAVRPLTLANPYLYYFLVRELCNDDNWKIINECFKHFTVPHISSCALPVVPQKTESFHKSATILNWWNSIEQRSLELSLEYRYMFVTDITNCYGSVNPQSFDWAINMKGTEFEKDGESELAQNIQKYLRAFQHGRNIGIPQGSVVFDFIGEILLGYSDLLLHERLENNDKVNKPYEILRFRDDYRVFCNDKEVLEEISYTLQGVLEELNFRMNSDKTHISDSVVLDSIKPDKLFYIFNTPIYNRTSIDFDGLQKHLLFVLMLGRKYPNCGQLKTQLSKIDDRVKELLKPRKVGVQEISLKQLLKLETETPECKEVEYPGRILENIRVLTAIATQIAIENVAVVHYVLRLISRMVASIKADKVKWDIINLVYNKLSHLPNSQYNELWLQNITYQQDSKNRKSPYKMRLCRLVAGDKGVYIWNNSWLNPKFSTGLPVKSIVDKKILKESAPVIRFRETRNYMEALDIYDNVNQ